MVNMLPTAGPRPETPRRRRRSSGLALLVVVLLVAGGLVALWAWWNGTVASVPIREHCTAEANASIAELDPEQSGNAAVITAIAVSRGLPARAASIGTATAIQESKLRNIEYGDRDSLGLFQQRPSQGWGSHEQLLNPVYATNAFYDALVKVEGFEQMKITDVAQKVQRSAYPGAYADHEPEGRILASALSGYSPEGFSCVLRAPSGLAQESADSAGLTPRALAVVKAAAAETGQGSFETSAGVADGGAVLTFAVKGDETSRRASSFAAWAVARASGLHIVEVEVGDKEWVRSRSAEGWTARDTAVPTGSVIIRVA